MEGLAKVFFSQFPKITASASLSNLSQYGSYATSAAVIQKTPPPHQTQTPGNGRTECNFDELNRLLRSFDQVSLIDVRSDDELSQCGSIPGAIHIPLHLVKDALQMSEEEFVGMFFQGKPSKKDRNLIFYARGPNTSSAAVEIAHRLGYKGSRQYSGGWEDYCRRTGNPLKKEQKKPVSTFSGPYSQGNFKTNRFYM